MLSFGGVDPLTGKRYVMTETGTGGMGARPTMDGIDCIQTDASNAMNVPIEAIETDYPIRVLRYRLRRDSGGAGKWRGGLGYEKVYHLLRGEARVSHRGERHFFPPWGVNGGHPGAKCKSWVVRADGSTQSIRSKGELALRAGDAIHTYTTGGGGYGDPLERAPHLVMLDVVEGRVSPETAETAYGVVIDLSTPTVDQVRTASLRKELAQSRPARGLFDRGDATKSL
jgi:N-methylhydantoinase B